MKHKTNDTILVLCSVANFFYVNIKKITHVLTLLNTHLTFETTFIKISLMGERSKSYLSVIPIRVKRELLVEISRKNFLASFLLNPSPK